ncbi:Diaminopimelate decarboxylase [Rubripirellula tenax]|uniref:Diaminopimelate decarboxylase n=1 Tax=Rubripirellula tenax TaxID=2528015 RepID=A0A5C6FIB7_9BACT|nr:hypothetical protein [Rubripirellula tenax]TWU60650.1 Diaminopimelate decarboxylase [Rubripirellula tenax]
MKHGPLEYCEGVARLTPKLAPWMLAELIDVQSLDDLLIRHGSPLHVHVPSQMQANITSIRSVAAARNIALEMHFACKANKCSWYATEAFRANIGIDVASETELMAGIEAGFSGSRIVVTASVKSESLVATAATVGAIVVVASVEDADTVARFLVGHPDAAVNVSIRISGFAFPKGRHESRFGFDIADAAAQIRSLMQRHSDVANRISVRGIHFHLDGTSVTQRVVGIRQSIELTTALRQHGHPIEFVDIGGGAPVQYLERSDDWIDFHRRVDRQIDGDDTDAVLLPNHTYGRSKIDGNYAQVLRNYPTWQADEAASWFGKILDGDGIAKSLADNDLRLHCQPGRALLDGCGITVARVVSIKPMASGDVVVMLDMNQTHCRTTSVDFAIDPILLPNAREVRGTSLTGFLAGNYCAEDDFISPRRFRFSRSVYPGDLIVFPNTAGYQMHFMESRGHQFELPQNIAIAGDDTGRDQRAE